MSPRRRPLMIAALLAAVGASAGVALTALADPPKNGFSPDPPAHASRVQWVFEISTRDGKPTVDRVRAISLEKAAETPRVVGRFALELYIGKELLDRVRFNLPLMGGEAPVNNRNNFPKPRFDKNVSAHVETRIADHTRAAYLVLVDRETGDTERFFWPPERDGRLLPWRNVVTEAAPGDFPDGGVRAFGTRDGGAADAGADGG